MMFVNHDSLKSSWAQRRALGFPAGVAIAAFVVGTSTFAGACGDASAFDAGGWVPPTSEVRDGSGAQDGFNVPLDADKPRQDDATTLDSGPEVPTPPPPQEEDDFDLRTPEAGLSRLFIPSAGLDAVVVVDGADKLGISLVDAGVRPTLVRALRNDEGAVVLNEGSDDVSVIRPAADGGFDVTNVPVLPHHNRLELSPAKDWAFAWYDARRPGPPGSLNDVSAIRVKAGESLEVFNLAVGIRPREIHFANAGQLAVVEADNGLSGVDLTTLDSDGFVPPVPVHDDPFIVPNDREVVVTPDGQWAVVRELDRKELTLVALYANTRRVVALPDWPSDLDLTPDGSAVVVPFVATQQVAKLNVPGAWDALPGGQGGLALADNPEASVRFTGHPFGSALINGDGSRALLYTTEAGVLAVGLFDLEQASVVVRPVAKAIARAVISPDGRYAVSINRRLSGLAEPEMSRDGYTIIALDEGYEYLELTRAEPREVVFSESGDIYVLVPDPGGFVHEVHRIREFAVSVYTTPQAPVYLGELPGASKAAVLLDDPAGWLTFIDLIDGSTDQVNSFELNSFIQ